MIGSIDIKTRPLKLPFLADLDSGTQVRNAIRLASTHWGGWYIRGHSVPQVPRRRDEFYEGPGRNMRDIA
jgi:hypothetical protein